MKYWPRIIKSMTPAGSSTNAASFSISSNWGKNPMCRPVEPLCFQLESIFIVGEFLETALRQWWSAHVIADSLKYGLKTFTVPVDLLGLRIKVTPL
jgi:hypothetical protein